MSSVADILTQSADRLVQAFAQELRIKDLTRFGPAVNTGRAADSIAYRLTDSGFVITGVGYIRQLIYGRQPGAAPPLSAIEQWMREKGIEGSAFPIARAIAQKGSVIFQTHKGDASGLFAEAIQAESALLRKHLAEYYRKLVISSIFD